MDQNIPAWGSYLYQNFLLPAFSPGPSWLTSPFATTASSSNNNNHNSNDADQDKKPIIDDDHKKENDLGVTLSPTTDYFGPSWQQQPQQPAFPSTKALTPEFDTSAMYGLPPSLQPGSYPYPQLDPQRNYEATFMSRYPGINSSFFPQFNNKVDNTGALERPPPHPLTVDPTNVNSVTRVSSLLYTVQKKESQSNSARISPATIDAVDEVLPAIPLSASPSNMGSERNTPRHSPRSASPRKLSNKAPKRRHSSMESDEVHEHDGSDLDEYNEGVERDGMIWGMAVDDYRALSARDRKRVRNRISARAFRAKRKEHLSSLESDLGAKDLQVRLSKQEAEQLRREVENLKRRLSKYERV